MGLDQNTPHITSLKPTTPNPLHQLKISTGKKKKNITLWPSSLTTIQHPAARFTTLQPLRTQKNHDVFLPPTKIEKKKRRVKKKKTASRIRISTSSADSGIFFSGDEHVINDEETETLVSSSRSFSTDSSSEFNPHLETIRESPFSRKKRAKKAKGRCVLKNGAKGTTRRGRKERNSRDGSLSPARLSRFQWLIPCTVEGKVRESFAVVKRSEDPYEDFKRSMMEMILEKEMFEEKDLEQLLHCFLSLNSREHHGVIVQAFTEIWETLFCRRRSISYRVSAV